MVVVITESYKSKSKKHQGIFFQNGTQTICTGQQCTDTSVNLYVKLQKLTIIITSKVVHAVVIQLPTMSVVQTMVLHVVVSDIKHNYGISCRLITVCFGLRKLSVLDILLYSQVIYIMQEDSYLVWKISLPLFPKTFTHILVYW